MKGHLLNRDFLLLWQGNFVSQIGNQAFFIASVYWLMEASGSASLMGILMMASAIPQVVLSPVGGTIADRYSRKLVVVACDTVSGISVLCLASLFLFDAATSAIMAVLVLTVGLLGTVRAFFQPAIMAIVPDLVPVDKVATANSLTHSSTQASLLIGQSLGGVLYRAIGPATLFLVDGLSYLVSAVSEAFIAVPSNRRAENGTIHEKLTDLKKDISEGIRYVWQRPGMLTLLILSSLINFLSMPIFVLLPFYVDLTLMKGAEWYGVVMASLSAGAILGYFISGILKAEGKKLSYLIILGFFGVSLAFLILSLVTNAFAALVLLMIVGILSGLINIYVMTIFQTKTPTELRGRVMSLVITLSSGIAPLGMLLGGILGDLTAKNIPLIYSTCGCFATAVTLVAAWNRGFRKYLAEGIS